jgi:hypothetical protein
MSGIFSSRHTGQDNHLRLPALGYRNFGKLRSRTLTLSEENTATVWLPSSLAVSKSSKKFLKKSSCQQISRSGKKRVPLESLPPFSLGAGAVKFMRADVALGLILAVSLWFATPARLFAQQPSPTPSPTPEPMEVEIRFSPNEEITLGEGEGGSEEKVMPTVTLLPNQAVTVTLDFSDEKVGTPVMVGSYDGGQISGIEGTVLVPEGGAVPFGFQPGEGYGIYRVLVLVGDQQNFLQFRVRGPEE